MTARAFGFEVLVAVAATIVAAVLISRCPPLRDLVEGKR